MKKKVNAGCDDIHLMPYATGDSGHACVRSRYKKPRFELKASHGLAAPRDPRECAVQPVSGPVTVIEVRRRALGPRKAGLDIPNELDADE
jgi:hypothetical protein